MSRLDELIAEFCPDGVKYVPLKQIAEVGTGSSDRVNAVDDGEYPFYVRSKTVLRSNRYLFDEEAIVIPGEGGIGDIFHYVNGKYDLHQRAYRIHFIGKKVSTKFAYYCLAASFKKFIMMKAVSATVTSIRKPMIENFPIPLPPLPVQQEIVRILDNFTELTAELAAELAARRKQYEYYRDLLLTDISEDTVKWIPLKECTLSTSNIKWSLEDEATTYKYIDLTSVDRDLHYISETQKINKNNAPSRAQQIVETDDILFATTRPLLKRYCQVDSEYDEQICSTGFCVLRANTDIVLQKWILYHIASSSFYYYVEKYQQGASYPAISDTKVKNYKIPVPPIEEQQRIIEILDRFDALCNDLSSGLPAEIEARQKQYEYYRDKLLSFKEVSA